MVSLRRIVALVASLACWLMACPAAHALCAQTAVEDGATRSRPITPLDLVRLRDIGVPDSTFFTMPSPLALSPDGNSVAFIVTQGDPASNSYCRQLMVATMSSPKTARILDSGGDPILLRDEYRGLLVSVGFPAFVTPAWSPDGRWLAYQRRDGGVTQLWRVRADGGDAAPVTRSAVDVVAFAWLSPDRIVFASRPGQRAEAARIDAEGRRGWHYDARITPEYSARPQMSADMPRVVTTIDPGIGSTRTATAAERARLGPDTLSGLPDEIAIVERHGARAWIRPDDASPISPGRLHFADRRRREVACKAATCADGIVALYWGVDGRSIVYLRREGWAKGRMAFYRWTPGRGAPKRLSETGDVLLGCLPMKARVLCTREASSLPRRIAAIDPETGIATTIYDPNPTFAALTLGTVERLTWRNALGLPAWGDLVLPPGHVPGKAVPLIVVQYHSDGFLRGGTGDEYPIFALAARGFAVLSVENPPTIAYAFPALKTWDAVNRAGLKDWADRRSILSSILTGVGQVVARGLADPARIGITGLSDGASSARFALINSRVFSAAAISSSSLEPKTAMTYGGIAWADYNRRMGYPPATEDRPAFWKPYSMAMNARDMDVPLLIQASDDEYLLALETFTALREAGKPVDLFVFPEEHHIKWQPAHRLAVYERAIDWFAFWFQDVVDPDPAKAADYARWRAMRARRPGSARVAGPIAVP